MFVAREIFKSRAAPSAEDACVLSFNINLLLKTRSNKQSRHLDTASVTPIAAGRNRPFWAARSG
jgi:hypothetical protein